ncbi:phospholipase C, phosphocholine-specific [Bordetella genomosp. 1]|uniref:phospholipase C n=1 Tax=Bordetella genomosp. 1 TaxID=1395607 RepID=A0A261SQU2_9BORD|nr:phospholipase C, phosphocholine-specific [Bordetella genomosp. 1]OZI39210.1 phospholipase C, phosphocholine-specific [Bordetella genomosp. 1]
MSSRRDFLRGAALTGGAFALFPAVIRDALAIAPDRRTGTLRDVEHIVVFMQENRSFDHYFGALEGVRGFGDRFPIPVQDQAGLTGATVWQQLNDSDPENPRIVPPFPLDTQAMFELMRVAGTPHTWSNAQDAWDKGRMNRWPVAKREHSMAYFTEQDIPFQYALARAFTVCDAYHCSFTGGTNTNRLFAWTGTNDGLGHGHGPALGNTYNKLSGGDKAGGYSWTTYPERLSAAGISWRVYQDMKDNYSLNPLAGFRQYRAAHRGEAGARAELARNALTTYSLARLREDVEQNTLPQVSWICATKAGSEHPSPSSPAQGADYTAQVLAALTANPAVWSKTVLLLMFDENDGFFDHMPPPAPPSYEGEGDSAVLAGGSTADTTGEYHRILGHDEKDDLPQYLQGAYGLGERVPMYIISPWTRGGWVNSQVFDHTSILRFIEQRFGVVESNISPWRRAVCGDLTSAFDFAAPPEPRVDSLPETAAVAARAAELPGTTLPLRPLEVPPAVQAGGTRPSRALPYVLDLHAQAGNGTLELSFVNRGTAGAVFHVYDRLHLDRVPRRYTVEAGKRLRDQWLLEESGGEYDLWVLGPNGFHRHLRGRAEAGMPEVTLQYLPQAGRLRLTLHNPGTAPHLYTISDTVYGQAPAREELLAGQSRFDLEIDISRQGHWYDLTIEATGLDGWSRRCAGRMETGAPSISDPAMGGPVRLQRA